MKIAPFMQIAWLAAALIALVMMAPTRHASAHANLVESDPADGAIVLEALKEVRLRLSENVSQRFSSAQLLDATGRVIAGIEIRVERPEPTLLVLTLPKLSNGAYTLFWKAFSEDDGHLTKGLLQFGLGAGADLGSAEVPDVETGPAVVEVALRWLNLSLLAMLIGSIGVVGLVLDDRATSGSALGELLRTARRRVFLWSVGCASLALIAGIGVLAAQAAALLETQPDETQIWRLAWQVIDETRWGALWLMREALLLITTSLVFLMYRGVRNEPRSRSGTERTERRRWPEFPWLAVAALSLGLVTVQALMGHAASVGDRVWLAVGADALHMLAASLWVGGIFALACGLLPLMRAERADFAALARHGWGPFSRLAAIAVGLLFVTGLFAVGRQVASLDALVTTFYGWSLLAKIALVLAMGMIGLLNAAMLHPDRIAAAMARLLGRSRGWMSISLARLPRLIRADMGLALLVLLLTGLITASPPPLGAEFNVAPEDVRQQQSRLVDDLMVTLSVKPGRPGQNLMTAFVASSHRPMRTEITRVTLRFDFQGRDLGRVSAIAEAIERDRYLVGGRQLSVAGSWRIEVVVRRHGVADVVVPFDWVMPPSGELRPITLSKHPIRPAADFLAGAALLLLVGATVLGFSGTRRRFRDTSNSKRRIPAAAAAPNGSLSAVSTASSG